MRTRKHPIVEADITALAFGGKGIARIDGMAVFVSQAVPGDRVRIEITRRKKNYAEARVLELLAASPDRVVPPCGHAGSCGGCTWQFLRYDRQIEYKRQHVAESIEHIAGLTGVSVHPTIPSPRIWGYRNKMEFTCSTRRWLLADELNDPAADRSFALGLHVPGTFDKVLDTVECRLHPDLGNRILAEVRAYIRGSGRPVYGLRSHEGFWRFVVLRNSAAFGHWMVNLVTAFEDADVLKPLADRLRQRFPEVTSVVNNVTGRKAGIAIGEFERPVAGQSVLRDRIGRFEFEISASSFFQTNTLAAERLYETVAEYAGLTGGETVLDLYSGTGTIPIFVAGRCREVVGIEIVASAVADARRNCELNGVGNCRFIQADIRDGLAGLELRPDVAIIDPPRVGMAEEVVAQVLRLAPGRLVYVSCNPATLARDLRLLDAGYEVREVQPCDLFPHTFHVEAVARLDRR
jgi:23S rRNA (uracil1939-C5)-methyltransferase